MKSYGHEIPGGAAWSASVRAGRTLTFTALGDEANLSMLLIASDRLDRLNLPDTLKAQLSACIRAPMVLMSDRGLALASVTGSSLDWHDALTGFGHEVHLQRFGPSSYGTDRNGWRRSAHTGLISELTKHGFGESDLHGCVNFFTKIQITDDSRCSLGYAPGHSVAGDTVTLRTEVDLMLFVSTAPHPMNPVRMHHRRSAATSQRLTRLQPLTPRCSGAMRAPGHWSNPSRGWHDRRGSGADSASRIFQPGPRSR